MEVKRVSRDLIFSLTGIEPWKIKKLVINGIRYRSFSFDINSKGHWNERFTKLGNFWRDEHYYHILNLLPDDKFSLLDIGCGLGDGCDLILKHFPIADVSGVDISNIAIEKAKKKRINASFRVMDILKDNLESNYDYITLIETLEHFNSPFYVVDKCLKYVNKSLIVSVPYSSRSGPINKREFNEHRFEFNESSFQHYNHKIDKITEYISSTKSKCIIYELFP